MIILTFVTDYESKSVDMIKLFLAILLLTGFYNIQAQNSGVELNIKGWDNDTIFLLKYVWEEQDETLGQ